MKQHHYTCVCTQAAKVYFDDMLCRQFSRMKKAGVNPKTWLANHVGLCKLVLPAVPLLAVVASAGRWHLVPMEIQQLMAHSALGKTIFNMAGLAVNAHAYKQKITELLDQVVNESFSEKAVNKFKMEAEAAAEVFKAPNEIPEHSIIWCCVLAGVVCFCWSGCLATACFGNPIFGSHRKYKSNRLASHSCRAGLSTSPSARRPSTSW